MNKKIRNNLFLAISIFLVLGLWVGNKFIKKSDVKDKTSITKAEGKSYWTCPMHPQIHMDHAGECPICHMKLVKVSEQAQEQNVDKDQYENRSSVLATTNQLDLIGVQKQEVEKMDLMATIPVSGRILSPSRVAFQIYEDDLRYVHAGLKFKGEDSAHPESEISGTIASVDSIVDPTSRTVRVLGAILKGPNNLLSETSFRGEIQIDLKDSIAIPESSVLHTGDGDLVYLIDTNNKLTPKAIQLGMKAESFYQVLGGLDVGDTISSGPNFLIDSEAKIRGAQ